MTSDSVPAAQILLSLAVLILPLLALSSSENMLHVQGRLLIL